jgi:ABC-type phosphate transport system permease subunit
VFIRCDRNKKLMKNGIVIIVVGGIMIICGLIMFYGIQGIPATDADEKKFFLAIKHTGTFTGLLGIGVLIAGCLLHLMNRSPPPIHEDYDARE